MKSPCPWHRVVGQLTQLDDLVLERLGDALRAPAGTARPRAQDPPCTIQAIYRQGIPAIGLSLERGTEGVPDDGQFHVVLNGEEVFSSRLQKAATARYRALKDELMPLKEGNAANAVDVGQALRREIVGGRRRPRSPRAG